MAERWETLPQMFFEQARRHGPKAALRVKRSGRYVDISWEEMVSQVETMALGLIDLGVEPGDRVAILSENRPEWVFGDLAALSAGGVSVPIYTTLTPSEIEAILRDSGAKVLLVSNVHLMGKVVSFREALNLKIILFDAPYRVSGPRIWWIGELMGLGHTGGPALRETLLKRLEGGRSEDLASLIYTSGTTGLPKGVMLTHGNFLSNCRAVQESLPIGSEDLTLSFLPLSHVFERTAGYYFVLSVGGMIAYAEGLEKVPQNLREIRPTILTAVPRFYEKIRERIEAGVRSAPGAKRALFRWALRVGARRRKGLAFQIAQRLVLSKIQEGLGGRIRFCISGGAPLSKELAEFFHAAGILILEGYGLTESSPVISANRLDRFRFGTVGLPLPGVEVKIGGDGEILTRGPHVMKGYFNKPEETGEAIDAEGWLHTGDIGQISPDGFLTITDRKKDLLKTSGGKLIAPQNIENALRADPLISDCVVIGDRRKYLTALIVPDIGRLESEAGKEGLPHETLVWRRVEKLNFTLAPFEQIKKITLLPQPFTQAEGELTPTLKVKRQVISERYAEAIEAMYRD